MRLGVAPLPHAAGVPRQAPRFASAELCSAHAIARIALCVHGSSTHTPATSCKRRTSRKGGSRQRCVVRMRLGVASLPHARRPRAKRHPRQCRGAAHATPRKVFWSTPSSCALCVGEKGSNSSGRHIAHALRSRTIALPILRYGHVPIRSAPIHAFFPRQILLLLYVLVQTLYRHWKTKKHGGNPSAPGFLLC